MNRSLKLQGRELDSSDIEFIRQLINDNPHMSRRQLSIALCEAWKWYTPKGKLKDMASRSLMLKLHERSYITLPARRQTPSNRMKQRKIEAVEHDTQEIQENLREITPIRIVRVERKSADAALYDHLLATYHYLGYTSSVGENMKYLVFDRDNRPLACLLFGSSAWSCAARDSAIGWSTEMREKNVNYTTNNTRFLILPWVNVPHLASHLLGKIARRINNDWVEQYGHEVCLLETFVDQSRFRGTCYKAANWHYVGDTKGRTRNDSSHSIKAEIKSVYLYPLAEPYKNTLSTFNDDRSN